LDCVKADTQHDTPLPGKSDGDQGRSEWMRAKDPDAVDSGYRVPHLDDRADRYLGESAQLPEISVMRQLG